MAAASCPRWVLEYVESAPWRPVCPGGLSVSCAPLGAGRVLVDGYGCGERFAGVLEYRRGVREAEWDPAWVSVLLGQPPAPFESRCLSGRPGRVVGVRGLGGGLRGFRVLVDVESAGGLEARVMRRVEPDNIEFMVLSYLTSRGCGVAPRLHCYVLYEGAQYLTLTEHVEGEPVASYAVEDAGRGQGLSPRVRGLLAETAAAAARLHAALYECREAWCEPEPVREHDVMVWVERVRWRARAVESLAREAGVDASEAVDAMERLADEMESLGDSVLASVKMRIHGDLHLYQTIAGEAGVVITDYEGEPYKDPASRLEKETPERDLAALLRSLDYAAALARASTAHGGAPGEWGGEWLRAAARTVLDSYAAQASRLGFEAVDPEALAGAVRFWLAERASYEAYYELRAATGLHWIPLSALTRMAEGSDVIKALLDEWAPPP